MENLEEKKRRSRGREFSHMAKLIRDARQKSGMSQIKAAPFFGSNSVNNGQLLSNIERGIASIPLKRAKFICDKFGIEDWEFKAAFLKDVSSKLEKAFR